MMRRNVGKSGTRLRNGFSIVELLVALTLSSLIVGVILGLTNSLAKTKSRLQEAMPVNSWQQILQAQLQRDFLHSRSVNIKKDILQFEGYAAVDPNTGKLVHRPTSIVYFFYPGDQHNFLIRKETHLDEPPPSNVSQSIVAVDIARFHLIDRLEYLNTPGFLRIEFWSLDNAESPAFTTTLVRHGGDQ